MVLDLLSDHVPVSTLRTDRHNHGVTEQRHSELGVVELAAIHDGAVRFGLAVLVTQNQPSSELLGLGMDSQHSLLHCNRDEVLFDDDLENLLGVQTVEVGLVAGLRVPLRQVTGVPAGSGRTVVVLLSPNLLNDLHERRMVEV